MPLRNMGIFLRQWRNTESASNRKLMTKMYFENIAAMAGKTDWGWGPESGVKNEVVKA